MWWETVGWVRPTGSVRSQMQASLSALAAMRESRRTLVGSPSALNTRAIRSAPAGVDARRRRRCRSRRRVDSTPSGSVEVMLSILPAVLTSVDVSSNFDPS